MSIIYVDGFTSECYDNYCLTCKTPCKLRHIVDGCNNIYDGALTGTTVDLIEGLYLKEIHNNIEGSFEIGYTKDLKTSKLKFNHVALIPRIKYLLKN